MIIGAILAAGKGTRINSHQINKVTLPFNGKRLINYAVDLYKGMADRTIVVVHAFADSVKEALRGESVEFVDQSAPLGTGHALKVVIDYLEKQRLPVTQVLVGYGDHMMFYTRAIVRQLLRAQANQQAVVSLISVKHPDPDQLAWGRVVRDGSGKIVKIVEQKDATPEERKIEELNAGFYCFDYQYARQTKDQIKKSPVTGEYYINEFIDMAINSGKKIVALPVDFRFVGIGVNTTAQLQTSQALYTQIKHMP
ncbi:NTP transferase domain-containing protein [Patescibacteria group bacterium]|nr:NTP transferase domain-containing protein [Patescibacteria group bacterium]